MLKTSRPNHLNHILIILLLGLTALIFTLILGNLYFEKISPPAADLKFGVSFSPKTALELGLNPQKTYLSILDDLGVRYLRLSARWDEIEPSRDQFNFEPLSLMLDEAQKRQAKVILVIGLKQPRWPECYMPVWLAGMTTTFQQERLLIMLREVINRYDKHPAVVAWQLENEPLFPFGNCPAPDRIFLKQEAGYVKSKTAKPLIITDSGEWRAWRTPMRLSDLFGFSLYRGAYHQLLGYYYYPFPPAFYHFKSDLARRLFAPGNLKTIITELQAEPWVKDGFTKTPLQEQLKRFSLDNFKDNVAVGKKTGFDEIYLWGVEWWYFMAQQGHPEYLDFAKGLFRLE